MKPSELYRLRTNRSGFYNIMPIENIPTVIEKGILSNRKADKIIHKSVAMREVQDLRDKVKIPGGLSLHDYANPYFDPRNPMMYKKRELADSLCILKIKSEILDVNNVVIADRNASSTYARFYTPYEGISKLDFQTIFMRDWTNPDQITEWRQRSIKCAEVLVPYLVPYDFIIGAFAVNDIALKKLREIGFDKKIIINSEIYFRG